LPLPIIRVVTSSGWKGYLNKKTAVGKRWSRRPQPVIIIAYGYEGGEKGCLHQKENRRYQVLQAE